MSGANVTINGGFNSQNGLVSIPSAYNMSINALLQSYLDGVSTSIGGSGGVGSIGFENNDVATNSVFTVAGSAATSGLEEITNFNSLGASASDSGSYGNIVASSYAATLVVQAPGNETITANSVTRAALFGA